jgi:hypothetical protein
MSLTLTITVEKAQTTMMTIDETGSKNSWENKQNGLTFILHH